eukprot:XP_800593.1 PREDICTED: calcium-binding protein P [Strongylocentrotus purpuratus]
MAEPPVYTPPEQQKTAYPPPGVYPQGQPAAYPQGQPGAYPQGQPVAYPQGQPVAYPQGQPVAYPQGQPVAYPQGQPVVYAQGQPGVVYPPGQQVVITQGAATHVYQTGSSSGSCNSTSEHYNQKAGFATGIVHLIVAILSVILGGVAYVFPVYQVGYGIWSAFIFYIPTGILGVASKKKNSCVIIAYMVMAILSTFHAFGMLAYESTVAAVLTYVESCYFRYTGYSIDSICEYNRSVGAIFVHTILAILGLVEFINCIVSAAYCCGGHSCCCAKAPTNQGTASTATTVQYGQAQPMTVAANRYAPGPESGK